MRRRRRLQLLLLSGCALLGCSLLLLLLLSSPPAPSRKLRVTLRQDPSLSPAQAARADAEFRALLAEDRAATRTKTLLRGLGARPSGALTAVMPRNVQRGIGRPSCPTVPELMGRLRVNVTSPPGSLESALLRSAAQNHYAKQEGGSWSSLSCSSRHRVALVIPYRDRLDHLHTLLHTLHPLLQRQMLHYSIYVVEQFGDDTFNKGVLMNAGVREALRDVDFHCFVFHDVDMIPEDDRNLYSCPQAPRHLSVAVDKFNYTLPYSLLVGGVFSIRSDHFLAVNGYSNLYWGWGGEDDDMAYRIKYRKLEIIRPPETLARYSMIKHEHRPESPNAIRSALLRMAKKRSSRDGLNTAKYRVLWRRDLPAYTHLMVDIGPHHRWRFLDGQRLVINF